MENEGAAAREKTVVQGREVPWGRRAEERPMWRGEPEPELRPQGRALITRFGPRSHRSRLELRPMSSRRSKKCAPSWLSRPFEAVRLFDDVRPVDRVEKMLHQHQRPKRDLPSHKARGVPNAHASRQSPQRMLSQGVAPAPRKHPARLRRGIVTACSQAMLRVRQVVRVSAVFPRAQRVQGTGCRESRRSYADAEE